MLLQIAVAVATILVVNGYLVSWEAKMEVLVGCERKNNLYMSGIEMGWIHDSALTRFKSGVCRPGSARWSPSHQQVVVQNWWDSFNNMGWALCPEGHFLTGIRRTSKIAETKREYSGYLTWFNYIDNTFYKQEEQSLYHIEEGFCAKPSDHPNRYKHCEELDITNCYQKTGPCECKAGYHLAGVYRKACHEAECLTEFRCCSMMDEIDTLDGIDSVITLIMDKTLFPLSYLAHYLGYDLCHGCRSTYVGEDFVRKGHRWETVLFEGCEGNKHDKRLTIDYIDWSFEKVNEKFGEIKREIIDVETVREKKITNANTEPLTSTITASHTASQTVSHTTTNSWKNAHEFGVEISSPFKHFVPQLNYKFIYENTQIEVQGTNNSSSSTFTSSSTVTVPARSELQWKLLFYRTRISIPYNVTVRAKFSTQFGGHLRWGDGINSPTTNYHFEHRGSAKKPTFDYKLGDWQNAFYKALKQQVAQNSKPWLWADLKKAYPQSEMIISELTDETNYEFQLTGLFTYVYGTKVDIEVSAPKNISRTRRSLDALKSKTATDVSKMYMVETDIVQTNMTKTVIVLTNVVKKDIVKTDITETDTVRTEVEKTVMIDAEIMKTEMTNTDMTETNMLEADIGKTDMTKADIGKTDMTKADIVKNDMTDDDIGKTDMTEADVGKSDISGTEKVKAAE